MKTLTQKLMTTVAAITLVATPALADMTSQTEAEVNSDGVTIEQNTEADTTVGADATVGADVETGAETTEDENADLMQETEDGASDMVEATGDAASKAWDATKSGAEKLADALATFGDETVTEIVGTKVLSQEGNDIGEIDAIVKAEGEIMAVVGMGGFLGIGEHDVLVPVDQFSIVDEDTVMVQGHTEAELEAMPDVDVSEYTEVEGEMTIEQAINS
ncbi:PRC-barrel domain-containing protein [Celeribacter persicus]|jgi:PRC-barrel domain.|uniref:PRC-barrel domain protein n=1 Tax=Celeribacter persicus TaxID=1651082 RepID=A0A2T5HCD8_9RHOB|nr:PRC-barrel domain-containing protein [Celeribacter persicus]PTQ69238.1 PRC-barrel domain protein [Celeribacter persicus]